MAEAACLAGRGYIVVARPKFSIKGLMAPHAYTIVSAVEIGCTRLVKLQNAWGVEAEWTVYLFVLPYMNNHQLF